MFCFDKTNTLGTGLDVLSVIRGICTIQDKQQRKVNMLVRWKIKMVPLSSVHHSCPTSISFCFGDMGNIIPSLYKERIFLMTLRVYGKPAFIYSCLHSRKIPMLDNVAVDDPHPADMSMQEL